MNFRFLLSFLIVAGLLFTARAADPSGAPEATPAPAPANSPKKKATPTPKPGAPLHPGIFNRIYHTLGLSHSKADDQKKEAESKLPNWHHLVLSIAITPQPVNLSETHEMRVTMKLENKSKKIAQLEFPTTQRIEVLIKNSGGKLVEHWSEDQSFANDPGMVTVNPGERLEYSATVATRDLVPGETFTVEGFFPNYEVLHATAKVVPVK
jgi:hypothetical protein